jgi:hypothetical protein
MKKFGSGIQDGKIRIRDGKFGSGIRDKHLGSATLIGMDFQLLLTGYG